MAGQRVTPPNRARARKLIEYRCRSCGRLLFRARLGPGSCIESRCPRCSYTHTWTDQDQPRAPEIAAPETAAEPVAVAGLAD